MPAKLDWRIEDEDFSPTDDLPPPQRRSGWARWGGLALFLVLALGLGLGTLWGYVRREQRKVEQALREVVELELAALRQGDRELFLSFQAPSGSSWREAQAELFDAYQAWLEVQSQPRYWVTPWKNAPPAYTGDVGRVSVSGKEGWAQVGVECPKAEGLCWQTWPYRWLGGVWRHVPIDRAWMGEAQEFDTAHLHLVYAERDEAAAQALAAEMEAWYARLAPLYGLDPSAPTAPQVRLEFGRLSNHLTDAFYFGCSRPYQISGPALEQVLWTQDGALNHETRRQLATCLAQALIADGAGLTRRGYENLPVEMWALSQELRDWALGVLDIPLAPGAPGTPLLEALVAQHGRQAVGRLAEGLDRWGTLDQALAASQLPLADSTRVFAFLIEARRRLELGDNTPSRLALNDFLVEARTVFFSSSQGLTIQSVSFRGDLAWVEVESLEPAVRWPGLSDEREQAPDPDDLVRARRTLFFRRADERWLYTRPDPAYFGARQEERSANLVLGYPARDARWYQGLTDALQPVLEQAAADLGIEPGGLVLTVEVGIPPVDYNIVAEHQGQTVYRLSPHLRGWNETQPSRRWLAFDYSGPLLDLLMASKVGIRLGSPLRSLYDAVGEWELAQLFPEETARSRQLQMPLRDPERFDEFEFQSDYYSLVAYLVEAYGPETLPRMLASLDDSDDLDGWLRLVTGGDGVAEVEPAWQAWVAQQEGAE